MAAVDPVVLGSSQQYYEVTQAPQLNIGTWAQFVRTGSLAT